MLESDSDYKLFIITYNHPYKNSSHNQSRTQFKKKQEKHINLETASPFSIDSKFLEVINLEHIRLHPSLH